MGIVFERRLELFADYHQILLTVGSGEVAGWWDHITEAVINDRAVVAPFVVAVQAARNTIVPVVVEVRDDAPDDDLSGWDHVTDASIDLPGGELVVSDVVIEDGGPECCFTVPAGTYRVRAYHASLGTLRGNGLEGDDHYRIVLWPGEYCPPMVLKRYEG